MKNLIIITFSILMVGCASQNNNPNDGLCDLNLNKIADYNAQYAMTTGEPESSQLNNLNIKAKQYKASGDLKSCIAVSEQALSIINQLNND